MRARSRTLPAAKDLISWQWAEVLPGVSSRLAFILARRF